MGISTYIAGAALAESGYNSKRSRDERLDAEGAAKDRQKLLQDELNVPTPTLPDPLDIEARRKSIVDQMRRRGRAGTILTGDTLGAG